MAASTSAPLTGYRVLVTRARAQAGPLRERLESLGATVVDLPAIEIAPVDPAPLDAAIRDIEAYDWIVFTSANGVRMFVDRLSALGLNARLPSRILVGAIGRVTAEQLRAHAIRVDFVPRQFVAESLVVELAMNGIAQKRVLLPQAEIARDIVANSLRLAGAEVDAVIAYRTTLPSADNLQEALERVAQVDIATFASPSSVRNTLALVGDMLFNTRAVCIGPVTAEATREAGLSVAAVADEHTMDGLVDAVIHLVRREVEGFPYGSRS